jgi:hypothetical protein
MVTQLYTPHGSGAAEQECIYIPVKSIKMHLPPRVVRSTTYRQTEMFLISTFQYEDPTYPLYAYKQKRKKRQETQIVKYI